MSQGVFEQLIKMLLYEKMIGNLSIINQSHASQLIFLLLQTIFTESGLSKIFDVLLLDNIDYISLYENLKQNNQFKLCFNPTFMNKTI